MILNLQITKIHYSDTWPIRHIAMWPDQPLDYVKLPKDKIGEHYGLIISNQLVSVISVFINGKEAQFRKFATLPSEQGKGYGSKLLAFLINEITSLEVVKLWCNARVEKAFFYEKFGFKQTNSKFIRGGKAYVIMEKELEVRV